MSEKMPVSTAIGLFETVNDFIFRDMPAVSRDAMKEALEVIKENIKQEKPKKQTPRLTMEQAVAETKLHIQTGMEMIEAGQLDNYVVPYALQMLLDYYEDSADECR